MSLSQKEIIINNTIKILSDQNKLLKKENKDYQRIRLINDTSKIKVIMRNKLYLHYLLYKQSVIRKRKFNASLNFKIDVNDKYIIDSIINNVYEIKNNVAILDKDIAIRDNKPAELLL